MQSSELDPSEPAFFAGARATKLPGAGATIRHTIRIQNKT